MKYFTQSKGCGYEISFHSADAGISLHATTSKHLPLQGGRKYNSANPGKNSSEKNKIK